MVDGLELLNLLLGHWESPVLVRVGGELVEVADVRYRPERGGVVLLLETEPGGAACATPPGEPQDFCLRQSR
ncbi:hypothetical protein [Krasilnikovia sp. MM14-A1004]|uniref:hypothetical protein n=1 Tax=Krasilnikovia sp. MM14-A1004 TaxID=3373541 RepID=UPI00399D081C